MSTVKSAFTLTGIGLHSGNTTTVKVCPAPAGKGRYFVRVDLPDAPIIPAGVDSVAKTTLSTELVKGFAKVGTVEHLLASLTGWGITDARLEIDGSEVPLLDGSAHVWSQSIEAVGVTLSIPENTALISQPIWIYEGDTFVAALPSPETRFSYGIDFPYEPIGNQWYSWCPGVESFSTAIAPARTFGLADQIEGLQKAGLIKGGSLENALVCDRSRWLNPPLRFENEPVRHKILDLLGDLSLLGNIPRGHYLAYKASHKLHVELARAIQNSCPA
ncbi:MAG: UDP-3-O-acyl-N-acetylglucosamine deacetylase [Chroococcopsis gigantea SAG 12.99]|jgi:UDP-3-O-[3-hydroxymyristoyl] N-acetylglucosamine deacetylase|nr:UDP-3-O-acyl-N-acetylglucosamine deacetylase [Chlorogloea purpurea SAG 13.99]MDV2999763.1 UDP-3-O-acyl-N-acetylglucosamine deacetylase [Chroococcopsis gigantea SAG 12.99]